MSQRLIVVRDSDSAPTKEPLIYIEESENFVIVQHSRLGLFVVDKQKDVWKDYVAG
jgi:hypothetical protein